METDAAWRSTEERDEASCNQISTGFWSCLTRLWSRAGWKLLLPDFVNHPSSRSAQSHPFDGRLLISGLSTQADLFMVRRNVSKVPGWPRLPSAGRSTTTCSFPNMIFGRSCTI